MSYPDVLMLMDSQQPGAQLHSRDLCSPGRSTQSFLRSIIFWRYPGPLHRWRCGYSERGVGVALTLMYSNTESALIAALVASARISLPRQLPASRS